MKNLRITSTLLLAGLLSANFLTAQSWLKTGNPGVLATDYIGTQNNVALNFKVNSQNAGTIAPLGATFLGHLAGSASSGTSNVGIGYQALSFNSLSINNTAIGYQTLKSSDGAAGNTAVGSSALTSDRFGAANSAVGFSAAYSNLDGNFNVAFGSGSLYSNTLGSYNTAIGASSLYSNTASDNTAVGYSALAANTTGTSNCALGNNALGASSTAIQNAAFGTKALQVTTGGDNAGFGFNTLTANTTGISNTAIGSFAMYSNVSGQRNTVVGAYANVSAASLTNATAIGSQTFVNANNKIRLGNATVIAVEGPVQYTVSDGRFKTNVTEEVQGLNFITRLRPVVYNFDTRKFDEFLTKNMPDSMRKAHLSSMDYAPSTAIRQTGFIAQEVEKIAKEIGYDFNGVHVPVNENDNYSVGYSQFVMPLVKSVQELNTTDMALQQRLDAQEAANQKLQQRLDAQEALIQKLLAQKGDADAANQKTAASITQDAPSLSQNVPNPAQGETTIQYYLPESMACNTGKCMIALHDANGRRLQTISVKAGQGSITLELGNLAAGIYSYQLIVNDAVVASQKLVVSR